MQLLSRIRTGFGHKERVWKVNGDKCTKLFHRILNSRAHEDRINSLTIDGCVISDEKLILEHITSFFKDLHTKSEKDRPSFKNPPGNKLDENVMLSLESDFSEAKIYPALCSLADDKTPGPDGLQMEVYKAF